ncbi:MAG: cytochrome-c peroxidase [Rhodobacteraceae bacterium]|nr:cytochrome-c peroxidase [Paracoccaceae bacterium]
MAIRVLALATLTAAFALPLAAQTDLSRIEPVRDADFHDEGRPAPEKVRLGNLLFFDKILSGNRNISCATCHHPSLGTGDGLALSIGEGGVGLGHERRATHAAPILERVPRNAQPLYFLGATEYTTFFHDGRVAAGNRFWPSGFSSPARDDLPAGLDTALAAQAMFPVTSAVEMAGAPTENDVAEAAARGDLAGKGGVWELLAGRLRAVPEYVALFAAAFQEVKTAEDITFVQAANAIAAFEAAAFRSDGSPFDAFLESRDPAVLDPAARRGMALFYGEAGCSACHAGKFQTDHRFHAIGVPQIGPGKGDGWNTSYWQATGLAGRLEDHGRFRVTKRAEDRFRFRTPGLRNVALTGPWGHDGAYASLEAMVRHHLDPVAALDAYDAVEAGLPPIDAYAELSATGSVRRLSPVDPARANDFALRDGWVQQNRELRAAIGAANELPPIRLDDAAVDDLTAFLEALTDPASRDQSALVPHSVPSGLPVAD